MRWELTLHPCSSMKRGYAVVHEAMWQRPAKCEKVNFLCRASPIFTLRLPRLHMLVFLLMLPVIAKHPHLISSIFHSFWVESISCLHLISLRFPLLFFFFPHLIKSCSFPSQITSSGLSRQRLSRQWAGGSQTGWSRAANVLSMAGGSRNSGGLPVSPFSLVLYLLMLHLFMINANLRRSLQIGKVRNWLFHCSVAPDTKVKYSRRSVYITRCSEESCTIYHSGSDLLKKQPSVTFPI